MCHLFAGLEIILHQGHDVVVASLLKSFYSQIAIAVASALIEIIRFIGVLLCVTGAFY